MTQLSKATMTVAIPGPYRRTAAKTNVSETERRADTLGTLTVNDPVKNVNAAKMSQSADEHRITDGRDAASSRAAAKADQRQIPPSAALAFWPSGIDFGATVHQRATYRPIRPR